jgi:hypothetical protein
MAASALITFNFLCERSIMSLLKVQNYWPGGLPSYFFCCATMVRMGHGAVVIDLSILPLRYMVMVIKEMTAMWSSSMVSKFMMILDPMGAMEMERS